MDLDVRNTGGRTQRSCKAYFGGREKLFQKPGKLKGHVEIYVNGETIYPKELTTPLKNGDSMSVLVFLSGG